MAAHERWIFPLLRRRGQFAGTADFLLFDLKAADGTVNEDVYAFANVGPDGARSLVAYNNRYAEAEGTIRDSIPYAIEVPTAADGARRLGQRTLAEGWRLPDGSDGLAWFVACRDLASGLEHLYRAADLRDRGLPISLGAYERIVLLDVFDLSEEPGGRLDQLCDRLAGAGVPSLEVALAELVGAPDLPATAGGGSAEPLELDGEPGLHGLDGPGPEGPEPDVGVEGEEIVVEGSQGVATTEAGDLADQLRHPR
jgi:hypothetical protein